jgi:GxxExxY protein
MNHGDTENTEKGIPTELNELATRVIGAALEVHRELGPGYLESVYDAALEIQFRQNGIGYERQRPIAVFYKGHPVGQARLDFYVESAIVLEVKAVEGLAAIHRAQLISYLKITRCRIGLMINFNERLLRDGIMRVAL